MQRKPYLEHANISVSDLDRAVAFMRAAFPHFRVRGSGGKTEDGTAPTWVHVGDDETYVSLALTRQPKDPERPAYSGPGYNHIGFVVDDGEALRQRLVAAGYKEGYKAPQHPFRKRIYFNDRDGNEFEFVEYLSDVPAEKNDYSIASD